MKHFCFVLLAANVVSSSGECMSAVSILGLIDQGCPKVCNENGEDNLPICTQGQSEYDSTTCKTDGCQSAVQEFAAGVDGMVAGLATCEGPYEGYKVYAELGTEVILTHVQDVATKCQLDVEFPATEEGTCRSAVGKLTALGPACPQVCNENGEDNLPICTQGQSEYDPATCKTDGCKSAIEDVYADIDMFLAGLATCEAPFEGYKQIGKEEISMWTYGINKECELGLDIDEKDVPCYITCESEPKDCDELAAMRGPGGCAATCEDEDVASSVEKLDCPTTAASAGAEVAKKTLEVKATVTFATELTQDQETKAQTAFCDSIQEAVAEDTSVVCTIEKLASRRKLLTITYKLDAKVEVKADAVLPPIEELNNNVQTKFVDNPQVKEINGGEKLDASAISVESEVIEDPVTFSSALSSHQVAFCLALLLHVLCL